MLFHAFEATLCLWPSQTGVQADATDAVSYRPNIGDGPDTLCLASPWAGKLQGLPASTGMTGAAVSCSSSQHCSVLEPTRPMAESHRIPYCGQAWLDKEQRPYCLAHGYAYMCN